MTTGRINQVSERPPMRVRTSHLQRSPSVAIIAHRSEVTCRDYFHLGTEFASHQNTTQSNEMLKATLDTIQMIGQTARTEHAHSTSEVKFSTKAVYPLQARVYICLASTRCPCARTMCNCTSAKRRSRTSTNAMKPAPSENVQSTFAPFNSHQFNLFRTISNAAPLLFNRCPPCPQDVRLHIGET